MCEVCVRGVCWVRYSLAWPPLTLNGSVEKAEGAGEGSPLDSPTVGDEGKRWGNDKGA